MMNPIKSFLSWNKRIKEKFDLKKRFPKWINLYVSRTVLALIVVLVGVNFYLDDFSPVTFSLECDEFECVNPFYEYVGDFKGYNCVELMCDSEFLPYGYSVGRTDALAREGISIIFFLFFSIFPVSRFVYALRSGELK